MTAIAPDGEFSLIQLTQDVLATTDATEMREIAQEIADLVPVQHLRWALSEALVSYVRRLNTVARRDPLLALREAEEDGSVRPVPRPVSKRWASASSAYLQWMQSFVGIPGNGQKRRSEVTLAEQAAIAEFRKVQAAGLIKEAQREVMFVSAMRKHGASTLGDLPEAVVLEILRWEPEK